MNFCVCVCVAKYNFYINILASALTLIILLQCVLFTLYTNVPSIAQLPWLSVSYFANIRRGLNYLLAN